MVGLTDYSRVDILGLRRKSVDAGAEKSPGSNIMRQRSRLSRALSSVEGNVLIQGEADRKGVCGEEARGGRGGGLGKRTRTEGMEQSWAHWRLSSVWHVKENSPFGM